MSSDHNFEQWYRSGYGHVFASVLFFCQGDRTTAEDATAEAYARAFHRWDKVSSMERPDAWVTTVALNYVRHRFAKAKTRRLAERLASSNHLSHDEVPLEFWDIVNKLPTQQRRAIALRYVEGRSQKEIAETLNIAGGTVAATLHNARSRMSLLLEPRKDHRG